MVDSTDLVELHSQSILVFFLFIWTIKAFEYTDDYLSSVLKIIWYKDTSLPLVLVQFVFRMEFYKRSQRNTH